MKKPTTYRLLPFLAFAALAAPLLVTHPARACGGCFHGEEQTPAQTSVVSAHRMALSISTTRTILWDQVQYTGSPGEFAWVLPVKPGAYVELGSDAFFETLDAATTVRPNPPSLDCEIERGASCGGTSAAGCAADGAAGLEAANSGDPGGGGVTVVHHGSVGPYETVTLHSDTPGALTEWLLTSGYAIAADVQPIIDAYEDDGFDFIALRLLPDAGVQQMTPVRVVQPGAVATLPLRMVAAGTGANVALTLFILGEGRWATENFPSVAVDRRQLVWDFSQQMSNYAVLRSSALSSGDGRGWLTAYAQKGALLAPVQNPVTGLPVPYFIGPDTATTIGEAFVRQAVLNDETDTAECLEAFKRHAAEGRVVVDPCDDPGACGAVGPDQIDARELKCGALDDLAAALVGMHPKDVWVTRLDANLPRWALAEDLTVAPALDQAPVENWILADSAVGSPCPVAGAAPPRSGGGKRPGAGVAFGLIGGGLAALLALRRLARALPRRAAGPA